MVADITDDGDRQRLFAAVPRVDILVNGAGTNIPEPLLHVSEGHLDRVLNLNVRGAFLVAQAAVRKMVEQGGGGVVINISSQMGHVGSANRTVYCMTKHAVEGLTKSMAVELAPHGIRVNSVAPTFIETAMTRSFLLEPTFRDWVLQRVPLGRLGTEADVAAAIVFLASPAASMITGTSLLVDGGWTAQ
jgi:NAD(P)-dependent dehydrogenase (short-subunit alcohol dehydrogenase family)